MNKLKKVLFTGTITIVAIFAMTISSNAATVKVTGDVINIRKEASTSSDVIAMLSKGVECEYLGEEGDWYKIKYKKYTGYVSKQYVALEETSSEEQISDENINNEENNQTEELNQEEVQTTENTNETEETQTTDDTNEIAEDKTAQIVYKKFNQDVIIRLLPLIYSSDIGVAKTNDEVIVITETSGWTYIQTDEINGWVRTDTLEESKLTDENNNSDDSTEKIGYISEESVNLRKGPGTTYDIIKALSLNSKVTITGEENGWYKVKSGSTTGYILKDYVSDTKVISSRSLSEQRTSSENDEKSEKTTKTDSKTVASAASTTNKTATSSTSTTNKTATSAANTDETTSASTTTYTSKTGYVNEQYVNLRTGAGTSYKVTKVLTLNTEVTIVGEDGDWYKVKSGSTTGYILKDYVSDKKVTTTASSTTSKDTTSVASLSDENSTSNNTSLTEDNTTSTKGSDIIAYAKEFLGCKYVYGGNGPTTFDCSGFTCYVFKHFGVSLPRTAQNQYNNGSGTKITSVSNLKVGDIVFFKNYASGTAIGHCGIYAGNGEFIHASTTTYTVRMADLTGTYLNRFAGALRVF